MAITLFNSIYMFAKAELNLTDLEALQLAQFIIDNAEGV